ncbi:hypothetical protein TNCV_2479131 [Trichonephila clavipes]|nr:hypothetical protein TNCV_2479131 [Trichonephila clavipes]
MREKGGNRLVPSLDYMMDALKFFNQAPRGFGEPLQNCVVWRCPNRTQQLFCWPILAVSGQSLASNGTVVDSRYLNLFRVWSYGSNSHQIHSSTFLDVSPGLATV